MVRAAVGAGLLSADLASLLSKDELEAAMAGGWSEVGADPDLALQAAIKRARGGYPALSDRVIRDRAIDRCGALMPRAQTRCIRRKDHPGPHRSVTPGPEDNRRVLRFIAEAKSAARLRHPNIVPTYESGQVDGQYYIAAQFVAGKPLSRRLKDAPPDYRQAAGVPATENRTPSMQSARPLAYARQR